MASSLFRNLEPLIVCGPSGVGKGTLIKRLLSLHPFSFEMSVSDTTRAPRNGEIEGRDYNFISAQQFEAGIASKQYIEYAQTHSHLYGTHYDALHRIAQNERICILEIDVKGAQQIKENLNKKEAKFLFVTCSNAQSSLEQRLKNRNTESIKQIKTRMQTAKNELDFADKHCDFFDYILVNDDLDICMQEFNEIINEWYKWLI